MNIGQFLGIANLFTSLIGYISNAETKYKRKKSGRAKKNYVKRELKKGVELTKGISTGRQKKTWTQIEEPVSNLIDSICDILFKRRKK